MNRAGVQRTPPFRGSNVCCSFPPPNSASQIILWSSAVGLSISDAIKAGTVGTQLDVLPSAAFVRPVPSTPTEVREFTHWLVAVASTKSCEVVEKEYFQKYGTTEDSSCPCGTILKDRSANDSSRRARQSAAVTEQSSSGSKPVCQHCHKPGYNEASCWVKSTQTRLWCP